MLTTQLILDIIILFIAVIDSLLFIIILLSFIFGKTKSNFMSILHVHLSVISLIEVANYMYFFDTKSEEKPGIFCDIQSSIVPSLGVAQVSVLSLIGIMMKNIFNNPDNIESYTKVNYILIIIFGWIIPIVLFILSLIKGINKVDLSGYCRPDENHIILAVILIFNISSYIMFFYSVLSLRSTVKSYFKNREEEKEGVRFLKKLRRYDLLLVGSIVKWVGDIGLFVLIMIYKYHPTLNNIILVVFTYFQKFIEVIVVPFFTLTFTLTSTRKQIIKEMLQCKEGEEVLWKKEYVASTEGARKAIEFQTERSSSLLE